MYISYTNYLLSYNTVYRWLDEKHAENDGLQI